MQMYEVVQLQVRSAGQLGSAFESHVGVKQGDPLSPLLFGILIDRLENYLKSRCPESGTRLAEIIVRALLYADDVAMPATTPDQLRNMLICLQDFCVGNSMFVNCKKSEVVVFGSQWHTRNMGKLDFPYNGTPLPINTEYVYLGLKFKDGEPAKKMIDNAVCKARKLPRKAMLGMFGKCYSLAACIMWMHMDTCLTP